MGKSQRKGDFCKVVQPQPFIPLEIVDPIFKTWMALEKCAFYKFSKQNSTSQNVHNPISLKAYCKFY